MERQDKQEAVPIARLLGDDRHSVVAWVYLWNTSELSILWLSDGRDVAFIDPPIGLETLAKAKAIGVDSVTDFLGVLSSDGESDHQ